MTKGQHFKHAAFVVVTALLSVAVEAFAPTGALGHYQWAAPALGAAVYLLRVLNATGGPPATVGVLVIAAPFLLGGATCSKPTPVGPVPPTDGGFVDCSEAALHQAELNILPSVETAVAQANFASASAALTGILLQLTASEGAPLALAIVDCVVAYVEGKAALVSTATADSLEALKVQNAMAWLKAHPANISGAVGP